MNELKYDPSDFINYDDLDMIKWMLGLIEEKDIKVKEKVNGC